MDHKSSRSQDLSSGQQHIGALDGKIKELQTYFDALNSKSQPASKSPVTNGAELSKAALAALLFSKAPSEFLQGNSVKRLAEVVDNGFVLLQDFLSKNNPLAADVGSFRNEAGENVCNVSLVLEDRPFIINTITECIQEFGGSISTFLHPVFTQHGRKISLSYIELEHHTEEERLFLRRRIASALQDLIFVTDDHDAMRSLAMEAAERLSSGTQKQASSGEPPDEVSRFLKWICDDSFVFVGACTLKNHEHTLLSKFGALKTQEAYLKNLQAEIVEDAKARHSRKVIILITKTRTFSPVHRRIRLLNIVVHCPESPDTKGTAAGTTYAWVGILTSKALLQESSTIPLIRRKLESILKLEEAIPNSHNYKNIVNAIDTMPKDEALRFDFESIYEDVKMVVNLRNRNETRVSLHLDASRRGVSVLVALPKERCTSSVREEVQEYLESALGANPHSADYSLSFTYKPMARFYFYVPFASGDIPEVDVDFLEKRIIALTRSWNDQLEDVIEASEHFTDSEHILLRYGIAFGEDYQALHSPEDAESDILAMERLSVKAPLEIGMCLNVNKGSDTFTLIAYHLETEITISKAVPILENAGLEVLREETFVIYPRGGPAIYTHRFDVRSKFRSNIDALGFREILAPGLIQVLLGLIPNDSLNSLMLSAGLEVRAITVLRTYCALLWQVRKFAQKETFLQTLTQNARLAQEFWKLFQARFDPQRDLAFDERARLFQEGLQHFRKLVQEVPDVTQDRVLKALATLLEHTVRTNFFISSDSVALKLRSKEIDIMPHPRPLFEIFVSSSTIEGVHLRAGMISRGGIRWSDRKEDYRTEVLGLMKTQNIKNTVIVPQGAKGGFIVQNLPEDKDAQRAAVEEAYRTFIRALLSVTDNRVGPDIKRPQGVIAYDGEDPYLVVAADKGTATFSDIANKIAMEQYNFWLDDAFASGGSNGYDHKRYAITAKGVWECVKRHFRELGIDYENSPFTVIGIGDMSGDVFGNGLILSPQAKLIAAFNHKHIFIDPDPEVKSAYQERKRMFNLPRSDWTDYDKQLISRGGGVFGRTEKAIKLSAATRKALAILDDVPQNISGEQLISLIMRAKCDLLWNGGIGTYVKSSSESNADVSDSQNDGVRINADELGARVVGEGGNLGFTQSARIEFAMRAGRVNTDAIDNSGGVDLSDHEVNLKILFAGLMKNGKLTREKRNKLLEEVSQDVVESVLAHNRSHAVSLSLGVHRSKVTIEYFRSIIREVVKRGYLNRALEKLPDDDELHERASRKEGLFRPELAVVLSVVKMSLRDVLLACEFLDDPLLKRFLLAYFPAKICKSYEEEILSHPLSANIIATEVTNFIISTVGITFVHRMCLHHSVSAETVIKCLLAAEFVLGTQTVRSHLMAKFDTTKEQELFQNMQLDLSSTLRDATSWLISYHGHRAGLLEIVNLYEPQYRSLIDEAGKMLRGTHGRRYQANLQKFSNLGLSLEASKSLSLHGMITCSLEMLWTSRQAERPVRVVAGVFSQVVEELGVGNLFIMENTPDTLSKWENELRSNSYEEIRRGISNITYRLLSWNIEEEAGVSSTLRKSASFEQLSGILTELKDKNPPVAALSVLARQLRMFQL